MFSFTYQTFFGQYTLIEQDGFITHLSFGNSPKLPKQAEVKETPLLKKALQQLEEYLAGQRQNFDLPLKPQGTPFQQKVWQALLTIPYGQTASYKEIAIKAGSPKGCRAVGMANNKNPIAIIIPCHRVIGSNGNLIGYAGGLDIKQKLLELESNYFSGRFS